MKMIIVNVTTMLERVDGKFCMYKTYVQSYTIFFLFQFLFFCDNEFIFYKYILFSLLITIIINQILINLIYMCFI